MYGKWKVIKRQISIRVEFELFDVVKSKSLTQGLTVTEIVAQSLMIALDEDYESSGKPKWISKWLLDYVTDLTNKYIQDSVKICLDRFDN